MRAQATYAALCSTSPTQHAHAKSITETLGHSPPLFCALNHEHLHRRLGIERLGVWPTHRVTQTYRDLGHELIFLPLKKSFALLEVLEPNLVQCRQDLLHLCRAIFFLSAHHTHSERERECVCVWESQAIACTFKRASGSLLTISAQPPRFSWKSSTHHPSSSPLDAYGYFSASPSDSPPA